MGLYQETLGFVIHQRDYKNSSLILEFFSQDQGMIHIIAKGIKTNKQLKSQLQYFSLLKIQYFGKSHLKTLSSINLLTQISFKNVIDNTAGLYLNELLHYSLSEYDRAEALFQSYHDSLLNLGKSKLTPVLRNFEKEILKYNGFELSVDLSMDDDLWIGVDEQMGLSPAKKPSNGLCQYKDLKCFLSDQIPDLDSQRRINKLMMYAIDLSINHRRLYSRDLLKTLTTKKPTK